MKQQRIREVTAQIQVKVAASLAFKAFVDPDMLKGWWHVDHSLIVKKKGGPYTLVWKNTSKDLAYVSTGNIKEFDESRILHIQNFVYISTERPPLGPMQLRIQVSPKHGESIIYLTQSGYGEGADWNWYHQVVEAAWPKMLQRLKEYLEKST